MRILDRYLGRWVLGGSLLALAVLLALFTIFTMLDQLGDVGEGRYGLPEAIEYIALTTPRRVYELVPIATLLGSLLGLGVLAGHSELTVMRAAGVSTARIALASLKAAGPLIVVGVLLSELVVPRADDLAESGRSIALTSSIALKTESGFWLRDGRRFVNVREVLPDRRLGEVHVYTLGEDRRLVSALRAEQARPIDGGWHLDRVSESRLAEGRVEASTVDSISWDLRLDADVADLAVLRPDRLSAAGLLRYVRFLRTNGQDATPYELALWTKLMVPLSAASLVLLAVPFVMGPLRSAGVGQRVLTGALIGVVFYILGQLTSQVGLVYGLPPFLGATLPTAVVLGLAVWMLRRTG
jgi:lipopolysaccharide export system permease protein